MWIWARPLVVGLAVIATIALISITVVAGLSEIYSGESFLLPAQLVMIFGAIALSSIPAFAAGYLSRNHGWLYGGATIATLILFANVIAPSIPLMFYLVCFAIALASGQFGQAIAVRKNALSSFERDAAKARRPATLL